MSQPFGGWQRLLDRREQRRGLLATVGRCHARQLGSKLSVVSPRATRSFRDKSNSTVESVAVMMLLVASSLPSVIVPLAAPRVPSVLNAAAAPVDDWGGIPGAIKSSKAGAINYQVTVPGTTAARPQELHPSPRMRADSQREEHRRGARPRRRQLGDAQRRQRSDGDAQRGQAHQVQACRAGRGDAGPEVAAAAGRHPGARE
eukprot:scaffold11978_cov65-Phaeocystis_antarctica.AAC.7